MLLEEKNAHDRDQRIQFFEKDHYYLVDGVRVGVSATGFIGHFHSHFDAEKQVNDGFEGWCKNSNGKYYYLIYFLRNEGKTDDEIKNIIKQLWSQNGRCASSYGTGLHRAIELYLNNVPQESVVDEFEAFLAWRNTHPTWIPYRTEWSVFDKDYDIAGQIDSVWMDTTNGTYHIVDWKCCKKIEDMASFKKKRFKEYMYTPFETMPNTNLSHYILQQNLYRFLIQAHYGLKISSISIVQFVPITAPGELPQYNEYPLEDIQDKIKIALEIYREDKLMASMDMNTEVNMEIEGEKSKNEGWIMDIPEEFS